jgi:hypothetical protein
VAAPCSQWIACSPVRSGIVAGRSTRSLAVSGQLGTTRRVLNIVALLGLLGIGYCTYMFGTAQSRMRDICAQMRPGTPATDLPAFAEAHGLTRPHQLAGVVFLVEQSTFGRFGCKVTIQSGAIQSSEYNFAD